LNLNQYKMAFIYNLFNGGKKPKLKTGLVSVNSLNVYGSNIVATAAPGTQLNAVLLDNYDMFRVAQTSAATDVIVLPNAPIGTKIFFFGVSACRIKAGLNGSGRGINGGADTTSVAIAANAILEVTRASATNWIAVQTAAAGTVTAPTPA
jgi:hypothetical protein